MDRGIKETGPEWTEFSQNDGERRMAGWRQKSKLPHIYRHASSYQQYHRGDVEYLSWDLLLVQPLVEFCDVVLRSHLPLHVGKVAPEPLWFLVVFPNIPADRAQPHRETRW